MFTGIVEETGSVAKVTRAANRIELVLESKICGRGTKAGDSIAVNGCCLTVVQLSRSRTATRLRFDLLLETWNRTNLQHLQAGSAVNLERALAANGRLGGHFVTGHIDGTGKIKRWSRRGSDWELEISAPRPIQRYLAFKGCVAVDGISLTVGPWRRGSFVVWIIPHTCGVTSLRERRIGDLVNLEADILAKYVERFCAGAVS